MAVPLFNGLQLNDLGTRRDRCGQQSVGFRLALGSLNLCVGIGCRGRTTTPRSSRFGWPGQTAESVLHFLPPPTQQISTRSKNCGGSCTDALPTTSITRPRPNSSKRYTTSSKSLSPRTGETSATSSRTTSTSSGQRFFGFSREPGITHQKSASLIAGNPSGVEAEGDAVGNADSGDRRRFEVQGVNDQALAAFSIFVPKEQDDIAVVL